MIDLCNWSGNQRYHAARLHRPHTIGEARALIRGAAKVRALGTRHSFNHIADTTEDLISSEHFDSVNAVDRELSTVTVGGGATYGTLSRQLDAQGYGLANMASLPHISVAGACATGTHGSGFHLPNLSSAVRALEIVTANGDVVTLSRDRDGDRFSGAVVALGGLGMVTAVTLDVVPPFQVRQNAYEGLPLDELDANFESVLAAAYSVSLFTDWTSSTFNQVWLKERIADGTPHAPPFLYSATAAPERLHPIRSISAESCTEQMGIPGVWYERLPHFRLEFTPSVGKELQTEYLVPRSSGFAALRAIDAIRHRISPLLQICEVRTVAADGLWLSPSYRRPSLAIHFTWVDNWKAVQPLLPLIESALAPFQPRPHWGKLFAMGSAELEAAYPRMNEFRRLLTEFDPAGKFRNAYLDKYVFGMDTEA